ncbi:MAG: sodium:solute symporter [Ignavibacteriales bacterium]|nr:MAG: sodium/solute symporter [Ignavibacteriaceae bacterium]MBW7872105.1 sodium/solute symporter [Ignavibacteria bacterium]MCZ2143739.1 sodium:solute symporter [Ignavibacteriales bacterium]OQY69790.1 MAG: sodium:solute symporter [Ignavibacteriales bacterium UTCHB3]MBV6445999.1 Sodium/glucose cotransporter [Ignavibacteriaceae bacterium]
MDSFTNFDYIIVVAYLIFAAVWGRFAGGKQKRVQDYFLGTGKINWLLVTFSIVAAETSTLTFISIPGVAYLGNLNFLQVTFGYFIGRTLVALLLLPAYFRGELSTAYAFLEKRFGKETRSTASVVFIFTRVAGDGVRLFATAIPVKLLLNIDYPYAIMIIVLVTLAYTYTGGLRGVIWVDAIQMFIYLGGAIISAIMIGFLFEGELGLAIANAAQQGKFEVFNLGLEGGIGGFFAPPYSLIAGLVGGTFLSMASHGTDQLVVQRLLATGELKKAQKAVMLSGVIIIVQFAVFLVLGVLLYIFFHGQTFGKSDEIFPYFIIHNLPVGLKGVLVAGLLAAALSTLAGSVSSLSSSSFYDIYSIFSKKPLLEEMKLKFSKRLTVFWAVVLAGAALFFMEMQGAAVEVALSIASFTYGGLLGTFLLGLFNKKATQFDAIIGFAASILVMTAVVFVKLTAWTWFTLIGVAVCLLSGTISMLIREKISYKEQHGNS